MSIAEWVSSKQDVKEMTRRAILILKKCGENTEKEEKEFFAVYGENLEQE